MKKISKENIARREELIALLDKKKTAVTEAVDELNEKLKAKEKAIQDLLQEYADIIEDGGNELETLVEEYNEVVSDVNDFCVDVSSSIEDYMNERSEKWQESEKAEAYQSWKDDWEQSFQEMDLQRPEAPSVEYGEFEVSDEDALADFESINVEFDG